MTDCLDKQVEHAREVPDGEGQIFAFERDFAGSLRCIPMIVRFKLDLAGVKLSLRQWSQLDRAVRGRLVDQACGTPEEITAIGRISSARSTPRRTSRPSSSRQSLNPPGPKRCKLLRRWRRGRARSASPRRPTRNGETCPTCSASP